MAADGGGAEEDNFDFDVPVTPYEDGMPSPTPTPSPPPLVTIDETEPNEVVEVGLIPIANSSQSSRSHSLPHPINTSITHTNGDMITESESSNDLTVGCEDHSGNPSLSPSPIDTSSDLLLTQTDQLIPIIPSPSSAASNGPSIQLRFLHAEHPVQTHQCGLHTPISKLKASVASSGQCRQSFHGLLKIVWIFRGQVLKDDKTLADYPTIEPEDVVLVHVVQMNQPNRRRRHVATVAGDLLLHRPFGVDVHRRRRHTHPLAAADPFESSVVFRVIFTIVTSLIGIIWGIICVTGRRFFTLPFIIGLTIMTIVMMIGIVQSLLTQQNPQPNHTNQLPNQLHQPIQPQLHLNRPIAQPVM